MNPKYIFCLLISIIYLIQPFFSQQSSNMEVYQADFNSHGRFSTQGLLNSISHSHIVDEMPPCSDCIEVISKRTRYEKYYEFPNDPGKFIIQKSYGPTHYLKNGNWETINYKITPKNNYILETISSDEPMGIDFQDKHSFMRLHQGYVGFNNWKLIVVDTENQLEKIELSANWEKGTSGKDGIYIEQIFPGIDAEISFRNGSIKTNFVIQSFEFPEYEELIFIDHFTLNGSDKNIIIKENSAIVEVLSKNNESLLFINPAFGYVKSDPKNTIKDFNYQTSDNQLRLVIPIKWITDNIHQLPLVIDPIVTSSNFLAQASINGSGYNATCFNGFCSYFLTVPTPANAVLTDVQWSFNYIATSPCWLSDGAVSFFRGTCRSPSNSNFFWFCNLNSPGTCTGTNISIFNDVQSCLPAPSCTPQNVNFEMRFHRCWSSGGCSNTCIGAASNWTITLTGRTLEFTNSSNPINVSATTICQGQSITASTSGSFGVSPYSFNWSLDPSGTPSLGNTSSVSISFPNSGTFTLYGFITDACGNQVSATRTITVNPAPTPTITGNTSICQGQSTMLTAGGGGTYSWNTGATTAAITVNPAVTTTYTVTVTGAGGCTATLSQTVTVNPQPVPAISGTTSICAGQSTTLTASGGDRKSTRLNSSHSSQSRMPSSA